MVKKCKRGFIKKGSRCVKLSGCKTIPGSLKVFAKFVAEDDIEVMSSALHPSSDLDRENKRMNRVAIKRLRKSVDKIDINKPLNKTEINQLIEANEIHLSGGKAKAKQLNKFLTNKSWGKC